MNTQNPYFKHRGRAPSELGDLLLSLPADIDLRTDPNAAETRRRMEAAVTHAGNYSDVLLDGLVSMGRVLFSAGENEMWPIEQHDVSRLGALIAEIGIQLQFLDGFLTSSKDRIQEADEKGARK